MSDLLAPGAFPAQPHRQLLGEPAGVVQPRDLVLATELPTRAHPVREAAAPDGYDLRGTHRLVPRAVRPIVLIDPAQGRVHLPGKGLDVPRRPGELDQVAVVTHDLRGAGEGRPYVKVNDVRTDLDRRLGHGPLDFFADQVLAERREELLRPPGEAQQR